MKRKTLITTFCISTLLIILPFIDLIQHNEFKKAFIILFFFSMSVVGLRKTINGISIQNKPKS